MIKHTPYAIQNCIRLQNITHYTYINCWLVGWSLTSLFHILTVTNQNNRLKWHGYVSKKMKNKLIAVYLLSLLMTFLHFQISTIKLMGIQVRKVNCDD